MFRQQWSDLEKSVHSVADQLKSQLFAKIRSRKITVEKIVKDGPEAFKERRESFVEWGRIYVEDLNSDKNKKHLERAKDHFFLLLRNLGLNDEVLRQTFSQNKKEFLEPIVGETVAILSLVMGWSQKDKEAFSQALGEIGVAGIFAAKPFICLIAICGLAWGYNDYFHSESFKKGGVLGLAGITAITLSPGGFVGILSAIVVIVYLNRKLKVDRPIESQIRQIIQKMRNGEFFKETRGAWKAIESFLSKLLRQPGSNLKDLASVDVGNTKA